MSRRKGRILAFQALYSYDVGKVPLEELLKFEWDAVTSQAETESQDDVSLAEQALASEPSDSEAYMFARLIISGTVNHLEEIDTLIKSHLSESWDFDRVNRVTLAILRISVFALLYQKDLPVGVTIDEAVSLARDFGEDKSYKFVNAVLDTISKEINS